MQHSLHNLLPEQKKDKLIDLKHVAIVLGEGSSGLHKKSMSFKGDVCPTPSTINNLHAPAYTHAMDVDVYEVHASVALRESPRCWSRLPLVYHPLRPCHSISWTKATYERECSIVQTKARRHVDDLHRGFKRFIKP